MGKRISEIKELVRESCKGGAVANSSARKKKSLDSRLV